MWRQPPTDVAEKEEVENDEIGILQDKPEYKQTISHIKKQSGVTISTNCARDLEIWLRDIAIPSCDQRRRLLENFDLLKSQVFGDAVNSNELVKYGRYERQLDRKLKETLSLLMNIQNMKLQQETE